jgi:lysophospholipase L1-like esterase
MPPRIATISPRRPAAILTCLLAVAALLSPCRAADQKKYDPTKWEKTIAGFEAADKKDPPPKHATLFIGSSSIRMWKIKDNFPDLVAINRGFGGSHIEDSLYYADRIVLPYEPKTIVFYAGDNDIAYGKPPELVFEHYKAFVKKVHDKLPKTRIIFICIKPSVSRWKLWDKMQAANALIRDYTKTDDRLLYADVVPTLLGDDGKPRKELFRDDGLHLNAEGYKLWAKVIGPLLDQSQSK